MYSNGLASLASVGFPANSITDISLTDLPKLTFLTLERNDITDISTLSGLTSLTSLNLEHNLIADLSVLSGLTNLTVLRVGWNEITDISALSGLTSLTYLSLRDNFVGDLSALNGLTSLTDLDLGNNVGVSDIAPLLTNPGLGAGDDVRLYGTNVSSTVDACSACPLKGQTQSYRNCGSKMFASLSRSSAISKW